MLNPFRVDTLPRTPWKNGKGVTRELSLGPQGASISAFDWRVTLADIEPGRFSFSHFAGIDRTMVVTGAGMRIARRGAPMRSVDPFSPLFIDGEEAIDAEHGGAPIQAFNLMGRRGSVRGRVSVHRAADRVAADADIAVVLCVRGEAILERADGVPPVRLGPGQAVDARPKADGLRALTCASDTIVLAAIITFERGAS